MGKWYYAGHLRGNIYTEDEPLNYEDLYCETCGDGDYELGYFETEEEFEEWYAKRYDY